MFPDLQSLPATEVKLWPEGAPAKKGAHVKMDGRIRELPAKNRRGPKELEVFRDLYQGVKLFTQSGSAGAPGNGWQIDTNYWLDTNINEWVLGSLEDGGLEYLEDVFVLASSLSSGSDVIGVDLHPDRFGWIGFYYYELNLEDGQYPVIAHSFGEWLQRTIAHGQDGDEYYWYQSEFVDLGSAVPGQ